MNKETDKIIYDGCVVSEKAKVLNYGCKNEGGEYTGVV